MIPTRFHSGILLILLVFTVSCQKDTFESLPEVSFEVLMQDSVAPDTIQFENISENAEYYEWDFGDGTFSTEESPSHIFENAGEYTVTLRAYNAAGESVSTNEIKIKAQTRYSVFNNTEYKLYNLTTYYKIDNEIEDIVQHGSLEAGVTTESMVTNKKEIHVSFENESGLTLYVIFPYELIEEQLNILEIKKYTMVYFEQLKSSKPAGIKIQELFR